MSATSTALRVKSRSLRLWKREQLNRTKLRRRARLPNSLRGARNRGCISETCDASLRPVDDKTIVVMEGDETGQELLEEAVRVLAPDVTGLELDFPRFDLSL